MNKAPTNDDMYLKGAAFNHNILNQRIINHINPHNKYIF